MFPPNMVPTIGLPLLMEFRCYPDDAALGLNSLDVSIAIATDTRPMFRAFSAGGVNSANQIVHIDPDLETVASGGFNPTAVPTAGVPTAPTDNTFFLGQMDLVVRVSRVHSIWFDVISGTVQYATPVVEPRPSDQPGGTEARIDFRGASAITNQNLLTDATLLDMYGEKPMAAAGAEPTFFNGDRAWRPNLNAYNGARFFQTRFTFVSNIESGLSSELSAVGFAWRK
jgi:hypothetical protein